MLVNQPTVICKGLFLSPLVTSGSGASLWKTSLSPMT